ncbi:MAG: Mth938-like domain-containing protein [Gammaproteobacteria bacterium]
MQLTPESGGNINLVRSISPGRIQVRDKEYTSSVILTAETVLEWNCRSVPALTPSDFEPILQFDPEVVLLGSGSSLGFPERQIGIRFGLQGIGFEVMDTAAACRTYNLLVHEGRRVVAALIIEPA